MSVPIEQLKAKLVDKATILYGSEVEAVLVSIGRMGTAMNDEEITENMISAR